MDQNQQVEIEIEKTVRASYGKLLAFLSSRSKDIQACEDALSESFAAASKKWSESGIPDNPEAWIFQVAKNRLIDFKRKEKRALNSNETVILLELEKAEHSKDFFKDDRLKLMFVCCHPSIDESVRTPLILQTVLGLDAGVIASAFLTSPAAMTKKLVRAKQKIKLSGIDFVIPEAESLFDRSEFVAEAIFAIYGKSWDAFGGSDNQLKDLSAEALFLADLLVQLLPDQAEPKGLLAYILHCESRKKARITEAGDYIPLEEQDTLLWNFDFIKKAEVLLQQAFTFKKIGRFQIEAAIQSAHSARVFQKLNNWPQILSLYDGLIQMTPTVGAYVNRAFAIAECSGAEQALQSLSELDQKVISTYQPFWVLKAVILKKLKRIPEASHCYEVALGLTESETVKNFLRKQKLSL